MSVRRLAVIGYPVGHSRSPAMQSAALAALGLAAEWEYGAVEVAPEGFEQRVRKMAAEGFAGANVTVPHKQAALALADAPSDVAREIGAANTLVFSGETIGAHNTDADGFLRSLPASPAGARALVLGAGGAARAIVWALVREGGEVDLWNRTGERAAALCTELGGTAVADPDQSDYKLIVNTTAVGLKGEDPFEALPLVAAGFGPEQTVVDMVYPEGGSALLVAAEAGGATAVDGIEILVQQGALSLRIWTGRDAPLGAMRAAARA
ncbi:MAG TPA: shikimate dehydrogenase [Solirubrobacterales bacterium]|nr:shikimate dehydrogenase [Solirubrobacterales bacterium]